MAASASGAKPNRAPKRVRKTRYTCPACGNVTLFSTGEVMQCPACGRYADDDEPAEILAHATPLAAPAAPAAAIPPRPEPPTLLAGVALGCGVLAIIGLWGSPLSLLLALGAVVVGSVALSQNSGRDSGVQVMAIIGIVLGSMALLGLLLFASLFWGDSSHWDWDWDWGWWDAPDEPERRNDGIDVGIPAPTPWMAALALAAAAGIVRRRGRP